MRDRGLEWTYRLIHEPRRLWRRHVLNDPRFLVFVAVQVIARGTAILTRLGVS